MKTYSGWEYLLIDAANYAGHDKISFEDRIRWSTLNLNDLENVPEIPTKKKSLYLKACMAIRDAQQGKATGHMVAMDSVCSGLQLMSVLTGCKSGAAATGLIDPDNRVDAYSIITDTMQDILGTTVNVSRQDAKDATMKSLYGSKAEPKKIFGEDTPEYFAFYEALSTVASGAYDLLQALLDSWRPYELVHEWKLPDGFDARVKVMIPKEARVEVDELDHSTFTFQYSDNEGTEKGLSNAANVIHSVDAYVLRSMHRRCNYDKNVFSYIQSIIQMELIGRINGKLVNPITLSKEVNYYYEQYLRSELADIVVVPYLDYFNISGCSTKYLRKLNSIITSMLQYEPFELVTVHDSFASHANNVNWVRYQYKEILADIADSNLLEDLLQQVYKSKGTFKKLSYDLSKYIRESNYSLS